uniref:FBD domain-containing protein n=1 Tax=Steinernema glaseri TaxID=37863 RepID=A0A1I7ZJV6_9BILA
MKFASQMCCFVHKRERIFKGPANAMDSVPMLFIESVCALLSRESLKDFKGCRSAVWKVGAKEMSRKAKKVFINVEVLNGSNPPAYRHDKKMSPPGDLQRNRYAQISMLIGPGNQGTKESTNIDGLKPLFAYVNTRYVKELIMSSVHLSDSLFREFFPLSVNSIRICNCTFGADSAFPKWLRRTLRMNSLQELRITSTTVEGRKEDVEEDLIDLSLMHGKRLKIRERFRGRYKRHGFHPDALRRERLCFAF